MSMGSLVRLLPAWLSRLEPLLQGALSIPGLVKLIFRVLAEVKKQAEEDETQEQYTLMAPNKGTQSNVAALAGGGALSAKKN